MVKSKVNHYHFQVYVRDLLGDSQPVMHYRANKASLPQAFAAFRNWFDSARDPAVNYTMDCQLRGKKVWSYVMLADS